ncbi:MAG: hypothetical protein WB682_09795 [Candidatus Dormiibacterota bacterium]
MANRTPKRRITNTWSEIAKEEATFIAAATNVVESVPSPADMVDHALAFAAKTLRSQREALVPLLEGVTPKGRKGANPRRSAASAVSAAYDLAERVVETQRKLLHGLVEAVTPPLARHAPKSRATTKAAHARRTTRKHVAAHKTAKRAA